MKSKFKFLFSFLIITLIIICIFLLFSSKSNSKSKSTNEYYSLNSNSKYNFLTKKDTQTFFKNDSDNYIKDLTNLDIKAHKSVSGYDYQNKIINVADSFTPEEKNMLLIAMQKADNALLKIKYPGFDGKKAANMNWNIALTRGKTYEDGLPHTRKNVIFISDTLFDTSDKQLAIVMLHEKVHVYERMFPKDIEKWINYSGYKKHKKWSSYKNARSNPDINDWSYISPEGKEMIVLYKTNNPNTIHDVIQTDPAREHPYEALAYKLEKYLN